MATSERIEKNMSDKKINTKLALLEQSQVHLQENIKHTLERIERKIETLDKKIDRVEVRIYANLKWFLGISVPILISIITLAFEIYQYVRK